MPERRICEGCGKDYWWPGARWQHEQCAAKVVESSRPTTREMDEDVINKPVVSETPLRPNAQTKQRWSRDKYNAYQRDYMRKKRAKV